MRTLNEQEIVAASGGLAGTPIPFTNMFISGPNWPGGFPSAITMGMLSFTVGTHIGGEIYDGIEDTFGMSTGEALYKTLNDS